MPLKVHFLNVGRGDCTLIEFPSGRIGLVDIDNLGVLDRDTLRETLDEYHESFNFIIRRAAGIPTAQLDSEFLDQERRRLTDPLAYYDAHIGASTDVFRMIVTHPDMDHMTGLHRLAFQQPTKRIQNFWHTGDGDFNLARTTEDEWEKSPYDRRDWEAYKALRSGVPDGPRSILNYRGSVGDYWTADGVEVWAPTPELQALGRERELANICSMIVKVSHAGRSILLGGDATADETWPAIYPITEMKGITVLKASHHGRKTGYYQPAVEEMAPWLTITSVGEREHDATEQYRRYSQYTVSLRRAGDVVITIEDDGRVLYSPATLPAVWKARQI